MSYCVNCGVELDESAEKCALCNTPVINPNLKENKEEKPAPFASEIFMPSEVKKRLAAGIVSLIMLIPNIVCFLLNAFVFSETFWSLYICSTSFLVWIVLVFPFFTKKLRPYLMWAFDTLAVALYFYFLSFMFKADWLFACALPVVLFNSLLILIYMLWSRKRKRHWPYKLFCIFSFLALSIFFCGAVISAGTGVPFVLEIGIIVSLCLVAVIAFLCYCYLSKTIRRWLSKRFFV